MTVEATYDGSATWYPGVIHSAARGVSGETMYVVNFLTFGNSETLPESKLRTLVDPLALPMEATHIKPGMTVQARYSADRKMYTATVDQVTALGVKVTFQEYGNEEEVPFQWITYGEKKRTNSKRKAQDTEVIQEIPENLKILPTDTEAQKKKKKKRIKGIKSKNRFTKMAIAQRSKMNSWQNFQTKTKGRKPKGTLVGLRKESIFRSPDTVDGKVGVTGSGKGMTDFSNRKKYRLNHG